MLGDTATKDRLRQLSTLVNHLKSNDTDTVERAARTLPSIVTEQDAEKLSAADLCTGFRNVVGRRFVYEADALTKNGVIRTVLARDGSGVSAVMERLRQENDTLKKWSWLRVLSRLCTSHHVMPQAIRKEALDLAVNVYRSTTGVSHLSETCRAEARKILEALRVDLERTPEYKQLFRELGFKPVPGKTGGPMNRREPLEDTQATSGFNVTASNLMSQPSLTASHSSQIPLFPVPSGFASQPSHPQMSTRHPSELAFNPVSSASWNSWRSPSVPSSIDHHTSDSQRSPYHPVSATQQLPLTQPSDHTPVSRGQDSIAKHTQVSTTNQLSASLVQHTQNSLTQETPFSMAPQSLNLLNQDGSATKTTHIQASTAADTSNASSVQQMASSPIDCRLLGLPKSYDDLQFAGSPAPLTTHTPASRTQQSAASFTQRTPCSPQRQHALASPISHTPASPALHTPASPTLHTPASPISHTPAYLALHTPAFPTLHTPVSPTLHTPASPTVHTPACSARRTPGVPVQQVSDLPSCLSGQMTAAPVHSDDDDINVVDSTMSDTPGVDVSSNDQASSSRDLRDQHNRHEDGSRELEKSLCKVDQSESQRPDEEQEPGKKKRRRLSEPRKQRKEEHTENPTASSTMKDSGSRPEDGTRRVDKKQKRAKKSSENGEESSASTSTIKGSGHIPEAQPLDKRQKRAKNGSGNGNESSAGTSTTKDSGHRPEDGTRRVDKKRKRSKKSSGNDEDSSVGTERENQYGTQNLHDLGLGLEGGTTGGGLEGERNKLNDRIKELEKVHKKDQYTIQTLQDKIKKLEDRLRENQEQRNEPDKISTNQNTDEAAKEYNQWREKTRELEDEHRKYREKNRKLDEECQRYRDKTRQFEEERRAFTETSRQLAHSTTSEDIAGSSSRRTMPKPKKPAVYTTFEQEAKELGMVRLTSGHDVFINEDKLQIAVNQAKSRRVPCDGTKLARRLTKLFFTPRERDNGSISTDPKDGLQELNPEITKAIIDCCLLKDNTTSRGKVRNAIASLLTAERYRARKHASAPKQCKGKKLAKT